MEVGGRKRKAYHVGNQEAQEDDRIGAVAYKVPFPKERRENRKGRNGNTIR